MTLGVGPRTNGCAGFNTLTMKLHSPAAINQKDEKASPLTLCEFSFRWTKPE